VVNASRVLQLLQERLLCGIQGQSNDQGQAFGLSFIHGTFILGDAGQRFKSSQLDHAGSLIGIYPSLQAQQLVAQSVL
jgi:hypothetical protein